MSGGDELTNRRESRFRWLDRWLEPRWRALLTWVALAAVMGYLLGSHSLAWLNFGPRLYAHINQAGLRLPWYVPMAGEVSHAVILVSWFQPLLLRVGVVRAVIWLTLAVIVSTLLLRFAPSISYLIYAQLLGIPGLAILGRRNRAWMSLIAAILPTALFWFGDPFRSGFWWPVVPISNLLYGAVMLYGTDPLPRRPAEREDQR